MTDHIPPEAVEAAVQAHADSSINPDSNGTEEDMRAALEAAYPLLREGIAAEVLNEAADAIQALHPGEVKNSVTFLRERAAALSTAKEAMKHE